MAGSVAVVQARQAQRAAAEQAAHLATQAAAIETTNTDLIASVEGIRAALETLTEQLATVIEAALNQPPSAS